jgi:MFS family permease
MPHSSELFRNLVAHALPCQAAVPFHGFLALILSSALVTLDGTAVTVALPAIGRDLAARFSVLQWTTNASLLALAALVIPAGLLGDNYGRRRMMRLGLLLFAAASAGCAFAPAAAWLIGLRLVQGTGAALIVPGAVAILRAVYTDEHERARRFGAWAGWSGAASAVGPLAGGTLVDLFSWRAVFLLSVTLAVPTLWLLRAVPESRADSNGTPMQLLPTLLIVLLLAGSSFVLINGPEVS